MKLKKVLFSVAMVVFVGIVYPNINPIGHEAFADNQQESSYHQIALETIQGKYGNGEDRFNKLKEKGYEPSKVQKEVNRILLGEDTVEKTKEESKPESIAKIEETDVKEETAVSPVTTLDLSQTNGNVDIDALANYMVSNTSNSAGYSASEWSYIIYHESKGSLTATNPSSGAYGVFQLYGHGEYSGMNLEEQIQMASKLPAGSWVVYN